MLRSSLNFIIGLAWLAFAALAFGADDAGLPPPAQELLKACRGGAPALAQLKDNYLEWQVLRLAGKLPYPAPDVKSKIERVDREYNKHLTEDQILRYETRMENEALQRVQASRKPLKPDELEKLEAWFKARPSFREKLLLALDPAEDNVPTAVRIALTIREKYPKESESLENLVIAFAAVWDDPQVVVSTLVHAVPELREKPPTPTPYLDSFGWFVEHQKNLCPWFAATPWRLQVYLTVEGIALSERDYAQSKFTFKPDLGTIYSQIDYDYSKLKDNIGRLGSNPYLLVNLQKYGGVCRDQAYFARSVCRAFGLPAYMATGKGNTGGGHAWVGWIVFDRSGYHLESHGRYSFDKYFTAEITDPASGKQIYDYLVGIEAKGLSDEKGYDEADLYYRVWRDIGTQLEPATRTKLLIEGLKRNPYHREAWLAVGEATASGVLPPASADAQWRYLSKSFSNYPDFIFAMARSFSKMYKTAADKYRFYEETAKLFGKLQRQDLVAKLRLDQALMCEEEGRKDLAAQVAMTGMLECAGEGVQGVQLAEKAVALMREQKKLPALSLPLKNTLAKTPQKRIDRPNPHWIALAKLLLDVYKEMGDTKSATNLQSQVDRLGPGGE